MRLRHTSLVISLGGLALTALAACGGGSDGSSATTTVAPTTTIAVTTTVAETTTTEATTTTIPVPTMPLTGLPVVDEAVATRPAIVAKIDNHPGARPQTGLNQADIVYEENVEKWTRFAVVFQSQGSDPVGPLRSGRTQDINLVSSLNHPLFLWSGGNPTVTKMISESELVNMSASAAGNGGGFFRSKDKKAPHNLFSKTTNIWALDAGRGGTPPAQFTYRAASAEAPGDPATGVKLSMDGNMHASWTWDASKSAYIRNHDDKPHVDSNGEQVNFQNVVVITCEYKPSVADPKSPEAQSVGSGSALVFTGGNLVLANWSRADLHSPWVLTDASGNEIGLTPGKTWVELTRDGQAAVVAAGQTLADVDWPG